MVATVPDAVDGTCPATEDAVVAVVAVAPAAVAMKVRPSRKAILAGRGDAGFRLRRGEEGARIDNLPCVLFTTTLAGRVEEEEDDDEDVAVVAEPGGTTAPVLLLLFVDDDDDDEGVDTARGDSPSSS